MIRKLLRPLYFTLITALLCPCETAAQGGHYETAEYGGESIMTRGPEVVGFEGSFAVLEFDTAFPTPGARVCFGVVLSEDELAYPRFRKTAREKLPQGETMVISHRVRMNMASLEAPLVDTGLIDSKGGHVEYRIEIYDPQSSTLRLYDSRFRYTRDGDPKTGTYSKGLAILGGPFVDIVTHNSVVVSWRTDEASSGSVIVDGAEFIAEGRSKAHEVHVAGLSPGTRYAYRIKYTRHGDQSREYSFRTAPPPGTRAKIKIGYVGDSREGVGSGEESLNGVNAKTLAGFTTAFYRLGADFICFGGDLVNGYTSSPSDFESQLRTWKRIAQPVGSLIPIYEAIGNHEQLGDYFKVPATEGEDSHYLIFTDRSGDESAEAIFAGEFVSPLGSAYGFPPPSAEDRAGGVSGPAEGPTYSETVYSFNYGNVHIVVANSNYWYTGQIDGDDAADGNADNFALKQLGGNREGYMRDNQLEWIERDLRAAQEDPDIDWVFVFLHEPPFPNGGHAGDAMYWGRNVDGRSVGYNEADAPLGDVLDMRDRLWKLLVDHDKVLALMAGDEHNYSRTLIDSTIDPDYRSPIWQITSGGCGAPYYGKDDSVPWAANVRCFARSKHCCLITVEGEKVSLEVFNDSGGLLDNVDDLASVRSR